MYNKRDFTNQEPALTVGARQMNPPKVMVQLRDRIRAKRYSIRTEASYVDWARRYILFHGKRHPRGMGTAAAHCIDSAQMRELLNHLSGAMRLLVTLLNGTGMHLLKSLRGG
jgi:hypothetical protein